MECTNQMTKEFDFSPDQNTSGLEQPAERDPHQGAESRAEHPQGPRPLRQQDRDHLGLPAEPGDF